MNFEKVMQASLGRAFGERDPKRRISAIRNICRENAELHEPERSARASGLVTQGR